MKAGMLESLQELPERVDRIERKLDVLTGRVDDLTTRVDVLMTQVDDLSARVDVLTIRVDDLSARVDVLLTQVDDLSTRIDGLSIRVDELAASVDRRFDLVTLAFVEQRQYTEFAFDRLRTEMLEQFAMVALRDEVATREQADRIERKLDQIIDRPPLGRPARPRKRR